MLKVPMRPLLLLPLFLLLTACATGEPPEMVRTGTGAPLQRQASAFVAVPPNGSHGQGGYPGSGIMLAQAVAGAFGPYLAKTVLSTGVQPLEPALRNARARGHDYLLLSKILRWEDSATEWNGQPDRVSVRLSVIEVRSGRELDSVVINARSGEQAGRRDHPQDLLPRPLGNYAAALFK